MSADYGTMTPEELKKDLREKLLNIFDKMETPVLFCSIKNNSEVVVLCDTPNELQVWEKWKE